MSGLVAPELLWLGAGVLATLAVASLTGAILARRVDP